MAFRKHITGLIICAFLSSSVASIPVTYAAASEVGSAPLSGVTSSVASKQLTRQQRLQDRKERALLIEQQPDEEAVVGEIKPVDEKKLEEEAQALMMMQEQLSEEGSSGLNVKDPFTSTTSLSGNANANLFSGSAGFSYPVWVPPGRNGMTPKLVIQYSSNYLRFDSNVGYGWHTTQNAIFRSTAKGKNNLYSTDQFSIEDDKGVTQLALTNASTGEYHKTRETTFTSYTYTGGYWTATDTSGSTYVYGQNVAARQADPSDGTRVYKWLLESVTDTNGNKIDYTYATDQGQVYPDKISYTSHANLSPIYEVRFILGTRSAYTSYETAFKVVTDKLIDKIDVYSSDSGTPSKILTYDLSYTAANNAIVLLDSITMTDGTASLPPVEFEYYNGTSANTHNRIHLLKKITYPYGGNQTFSYRTSTFYRQSGNLLNKIPFVVHTLNKSTIQPQSGGASYDTQYGYEGAHFYFDQLDAFTRKYTGFHVVTVTDDLGQQQIHYFHQSELGDDNTQSALEGEYDDHIIKRGLKYRHEKYDDASNLYETTITKWEHDSKTSADPQRDRFFISKTRELKTDYDGNQTHRSTASTSQYDGYGNVTQQVDFGEVNRNGNAGDFTDSGTDKRTAVTTYATPSSGDVRNLPSEVTVTDNGSSVVKKSRMYYDQLALGSVTLGNNTKQENLITSPSSYAVTQTTFDGYGLPFVVTNSRNFTTTSTYDTHKLYPVTITDHQNHDTDFTYDYSVGKPASVQTPDGVLRQATYDTFGRIVTVKISGKVQSSALITTDSYSYNDTSNPRSVRHTQYRSTQASPYEEVWYYDGLARPIQKRAVADGTSTYSVISLEYDALGRLNQTTLPDTDSSDAYSVYSHPASRIITNQYDAINRLTSSQNTLGTTATSYDDWTKTVTDANGEIKDYEFDAFDRLTKVKEHNGSSVYTTVYGYDSNGNLLEVTDDDGNIRTSTFDLLGREITHTLPHDTSVSGATYTYSYDSNGNMLTQSDPSSDVITWTYDYRDRILTKDDNTTTGTDITNTYDMTTYGLGKIGKIETNAVINEYSYDGQGYLTQEKRTITDSDGASGSETDGVYTIDLTFDKYGALESVDYPNSTIDYTYNQIGKVSSVDKDSSQLITSIDYNPVNKVEVITYGNGIATTKAHDATKLYRLTDIETLDGTTLLQDASYVYDAVGNVTQIIDVGTQTPKNVSFTYDDLHRLTAASYLAVGGRPAVSESYTYDSVGNLLSGPLGNYQYNSTTHPHATTSLGSETLTYDASGNIKTESRNGSTVTYNFDSQNRLTTLQTASGTTNYKYGHDEHRVQKKLSDGSRLSYVGEYAEVESDGTIRENVSVEDMRLAMIEDGSVFYNVSDHLESATLVTDSTAAVTEAVDYFPYGVEHISIQNGSFETRYTFTDQEKDEESHLMNYDARMYHPEAGRFVSPDPWRGDLEDPQTLNKYAYARNNPLKYTDPTGETPVAAILAIGVLAAFSAAPADGGGFVGPVTLYSHQRGSLARGAGDLVNRSLGISFADNALQGMALGVSAGAAGASLLNRSIAVGEHVETMVNQTIDSVRSDTHSITSAQQAPNFVTTPRGQSIAVPEGAVGPLSTRSSGFMYKGGQGGTGLDKRVTGVRIMDPSAKQGPRVNYMNRSQQTVNQKTGQTVSNQDPAGHIPIKRRRPKP